MCVFFIVPKIIKTNKSFTIHFGSFDFVVEDFFAIFPEEAFSEDFNDGFNDGVGDGSADFDFDFDLLVVPDSLEFFLGSLFAFFVSGVGAGSGGADGGGGGALLGAGGGP